MKANIDLKTVAGVGVGVALGHFAFKSKNPLILMAFGIGGGVLAHYALKGRGKKIAEANAESDKMVEQVQQDIEATLVTNVAPVEKDNPYGGQRMAFNPKVGYIMPEGTADESEPAKYMDIKF